MFWLILFISFKCMRSSSNRLYLNLELLISAPNPLIHVTDNRPTNGEKRSSILLFLEASKSSNQRQCLSQFLQSESGTDKSPRYVLVGGYDLTKELNETWTIHLHATHLLRAYFRDFLECSPLRRIAVGFEAPHFVLELKQHRPNSRWGSFARF